MLQSISLMHLEYNQSLNMSLSLYGLFLVGHLNALVLLIGMFHTKHFGTTQTQTCKFSFVLRGRRYLQGDRKQEHGKHFQTQFHRSVCFVQVVLQSIHSTNPPCSLGLITILMLVCGSYILPWTTLNFVVWLQYSGAILSQVLKCTNVYMSVHLCDGEKQLREM